MANEKEQEYSRIEAENKRLKRLITRMHKGIWGIQEGKNDNGSEEPAEHLPLYISSVLVSQTPFEERINNVLKALGSFAEVSRIYIFENWEDNNRMRNTYEWCNDGVLPQIEILQDISYDDFPHWKKMLLNEGFIKASDIKQLPSELHDFLAAQSIESILVIPLYVNSSFFGFIGFDECSYHREWLPHEFDLLKLASRFISNAYENEINQKQIIKHSNDQKLLLDISRLLVSKLSFSEKIDGSIEKVANHYQLDQVMVYENGDGNGHCSLTNNYQTQTAINTEDSSIQLLSYDRDLPGWMETFKQTGVFCSANSPLQHRASNTLINHLPNNIIIAVPIRSKEAFWGFMVTVASKKKPCNSYNETAFSTVADMMAGAYERENANLKLKQNHSEILTINREIEKKEAFLQNLLSSSPVGIVLVRNRKIEYINSAIIQTSGYLKEELIGSPLSDYYYGSKEDNAKIDAFYKEIDEEGIATFEVTLRDKIGDPIELRVIGKQMPDNNKDMCYLLISEDISNIKEAEKNLQESEIRNQKIIESTVDGIFIFNTDNDLVFANAAGLSMLSYDFDELASIKVEQIFPTSLYYSRFEEAMNKIKQGDDYIGDVQLLDKNNEIIHAEIYATSIQLKGAEHAYFSLHNISRRKRKEEELKQSEYKFRALTENSPDHIIRIDRKGTLSFCNAAFLRDFSLQSDDCIGKKITELRTLPDTFINGLNNAIGDVLISKTITPIELEFKNNGHMYAFDWTITPETDEQSNLSSLLLVGRNFTLRKRAEQELIVAKEKAESADNLKSAFLANMSHEIRTPLNAIVGFTNLLNEEFISDEEKQEYIQIINTSSENLMSLINDIVDLAKIESGELSIHIQESNPNEFLKKLFNLYEKRMDLDSKKHLKFYLNIPEDSEQYLVPCDLKRLNQVFINLLGNAFKFTPKGFIEMGYAKEDDQLRFYVRDTGIGISPEKQAIIFDPFRQEEEDTSKHYGGTGLGLSISKRLIDAMNSKLELSSEKNKGSEFSFCLPISIQRTEPVIKKIPKVDKQVDITIPLNISWPDKIVLLVDATSTAQLQMRKNLEQTKITLISARTPNSARELLLKRNDIDLVLMDTNMPGLNAEEFIQSIRQMNISIPFIAQSAEFDKEKRSTLISSGFDDTISKPIQKDELLQKINIALNGIHKSQLN